MKTEQHVGEQMAAPKRTIKLYRLAEDDAEAGFPSASFRRLDLRQSPPGHSAVACVTAPSSRKLAYGLSSPSADDQSPRNHLRSVLLDAVRGRS